MGWGGGGGSGVGVAAHVPPAAGSRTRAARQRRSAGRRRGAQAQTATPPRPLLPTHGASASLSAASSSGTAALGGAALVSGAAAALDSCRPLPALPRRRSDRKPMLGPGATERTEPGKICKSRSKADSPSRAGVHSTTSPNGWMVVRLLSSHCARARLGGRPCTGAAQMARGVQ